MFLSQKIEWMKQYARNKSHKLELEMGEFLTLPDSEKQKVNGAAAKSHLVELPAIAVHDREITERFMKGPWIGDTEVSSQNSEHVKRLERKLYQLLRDIRSGIAEDLSSKLFIRIIRVLYHFSASYPSSYGYQLT